MPGAKPKLPKARPKELGTKLQLDLLEAARYSPKEVAAAYVPDLWASFIISLGSAYKKSLAMAVQ